MPRPDKDMLIQEMLTAHEASVASAPVKPDSVEWWRQVAQGLGVECHTLKAKLAEQDRALARLRDALRAVQSPARGYPCWCDESHNAVEHGHQPKCQWARAALAEDPTP